MKNRKAVVKIHELVVRIYVIPKCSHNRPTDKSVDFSPFHSIVYVHPPPTYLFRACASFTDRL